LITLLLIFTDDLNPFPEAKTGHRMFFQLLVPTNLKLKKQELFLFAKLLFGFTSITFVGSPTQMNRG
jgi:hypothetical protein